MTSEQAWPVPHGRFATLLRHPRAKERQSSGNTGATWSSSATWWDC